MSNYNLFDMIVPSKCIAEAQQLLDLLFTRKIEHFRALDDDKRAKLLTKDPYYCHSIGYNEPIQYDEFRKVTLQSWFQELADEYQLRSRNGRQVIVNDGAILSHFAFLGESYVKSIRKGKDPVKWIVVQEDGKKPVFMLATTYIEVRKGACSARAALTGQKTSTVQVPKIAEENDSEKIAAEIERLRKENASLAARTPIESVH